MIEKLKGVTPYIVAIGFGVSGLVALLYWGAPNAEHLKRLQERDAEGGAPSTRQHVAEEDSLEAVEYAKGVQRGSCNQVIDMTWWMRERLLYVESNATTSGEVRKAKEDFCEKMLDRVDEKNLVTAEGVEDQYLFVPGATIEVVGMDRGRQGLAKPAAKRIWMQVRYPVQATALRDPEGNQIRALVVGVNLSEDGYVLKAGVLGNLEIDLDSFSYDWTTKGER